MRRLSLSTKLLAAALPLIVAVAGLLALTVRSDLHDIADAESGAELGGVWTPLIAALDAVESEAASVSWDPDPTIGGLDPVDQSLRRVTDQTVNDLRVEIELLGAFDAANDHVTSARSALSAARRTVDMQLIAPDMAAEITPAEAYRTAAGELVAVGQLMPSEAGDADLGRELLAVVKLAEAKLRANDVIAGTMQWPNDLRNTTPLVQARDSYSDMVVTFGEFEAVAPDEWATQFRQSGFNTSLGRFRSSLDSVTRAADAGRIETFDTAGFTTFVGQSVEFQREISQSIVDRANADVAATRSATMLRIGIILAAILLAAVIAWVILRSITRRVKAIAHSANRVAEEQLPALVEALRDPRGKAVLPEIEPVDAKGGDDLAHLAHAFNSMQATLVDVAHEQVEVLRRGVSDIFITMARRNRSLIDRQLSMLDEYEAGVDDPDVLANYYQLDHLATRMRRNSESLLVLANAESNRRRVKATEIDDVVRASIGEVEDYRRIEIQHLESLQVRGNVVADISHLLAELLDNAASFSPPGSSVRVGGRNAGTSYLLRIVDDGVGIGPDRLRELNELLRDPPIVGLSVESTLGISVVSLLADKHGIEVTLSAANPGITVDVVLPNTLFETVVAPTRVLAPTAPAAADGEQITTSNHHPDADESFEVAAEPLGATPSSGEGSATSPGPVAWPTAPTVGDGEQIAASNESPDADDDESFEKADSAPSSTAPPALPAWPTAPSAADGEQITTSNHHPDGDESFEKAPRPVASTPLSPPPPAAPALPVSRAWTSRSHDRDESVPGGAGSQPSIDPLDAAIPAVPAATNVSATPTASTGDWTMMSLDLTALDLHAANDASGDPSRAATTAAADTSVPPAPAAPSGNSTPSIPASTCAPLAGPAMPPPEPTRQHAEFDRPPAPPIGVLGPSLSPVSPADARPAIVPAPAPADGAPVLPTRIHRGIGPEGPDRLAGQASGVAADTSAVATSAAGALQAALTAFDQGRSAAPAPDVGAALPTRARSEEPLSSFDETVSVTQSRVDPSALRDRLRAFQAEFSSAGDATGPDIYDRPDQHNDLGGDPR